MKTKSGMLSDKPRDRVAYSTYVLSADVSGQTSLGQSILDISPVGCLRLPVAGSLGDKTVKTPKADKESKMGYLVANTPDEHFSVDNYPITVGAKFWNNDLRVCEITEVATYSNKYTDSGCVQTWHATNRGEFDTLSGHLRHIGRLVRYWDGKDAEAQPLS